MEPGACMQVEPGTMAVCQRTHSRDWETQYLLAASALDNSKKSDTGDGFTRALPAVQVRMSNLEGHRPVTATGRDVDKRAGCIRKDTGKLENNGVYPEDAGRT